MWKCRFWQTNRGNILCLGERDCSLQLNKQKVLEETPSPVMTEDIRRKMMDAAVLAAKAAIIPMQAQ